MANREYYGESVPAHLYGEETRNFSTMQCPEYNPTQVRHASRRLGFPLGI